MAGRLRAAWRVASLVLGLTATPLAAQEDVAPAQPAPLRSVVVTIDQEELFLRSAYGQEILGRLDREASALSAENREIEARLEAEEKDLTAKRAEMDPAAFRAEAEAFDDKVVELRAAQDAKARELVRRRERAPQAFFQEVGPILATLAQERGALVILDSREVVLAAEQIDITAAAIARIDARMTVAPDSGDGPADGAAPPGSSGPAAPDPVGETGDD